VNWLETKLESCLIQYEILPFLFTLIFLHQISYYLILLILCRMMALRVDKLKLLLKSRSIPNSEQIIGNVCKYPVMQFYLFLHV
jgi:hypothetical protein